MSIHRKPLSEGLQRGFILLGVSRNERPVNLTRAIVARPPYPGSATLAEIRSPTERVVWPCPVKSSTCDMSPGLNIRFVPSPIPISIWPTRTMTY